MKKLFNILLLTCLSLTAIAQHQKPNFIIIYVDDMGYGDLDINGQPNISTPNLNKMAKQGTVFSNYYSASPACTASRYALLTGKYPPRSGFRWVLDPKDPKGIHDKEITLAEYLKEQAYTTAIFGKWHLGATKQAYLPLQNGFDKYVGLPYSNDMIPPKYQDIAFMKGNDTLSFNPDQSQLTRIYTEEAIQFVTENKKKPFFIYLPYAMPHTPLHPSKQFEGKSKRGAYGDVVEELDYYIGKLMSKLEKEGLAKNTYVIFTSDNGPWILQKENGGSAGLFKDGKGSTWEGGMRVPFILWGHKNIQQQRVVQETFSALDILPSIVKLSNGEVNKSSEIDGIDLSNLFTSNGNGRDLFYYFGLDHELFAVRKGRWKLHVKTYSQLGKEYFNKKIPLLFDLDVDPSENYDLADKNPEIVAELMTLIKNKKEQILTQGSYWKN